jgi:hypothetical protein
MMITNRLTVPYFSLSLWDFNNLWRWPVLGLAQYIHLAFYAHMVKVYIVELLAFALRR